MNLELWEWIGGDPDFVFSHTSGLSTTWGNISPVDTWTKRDKSGFPHSTTGPARITVADYGKRITVQWHIHGSLHREDGPAVVDSYKKNGGIIKHFYLHGIYYYTQEQYSKELLRIQQTREAKKIKQNRKVKFRVDHPFDFAKESSATYVRESQKHHKIQNGRGRTVKRDSVKRHQTHRKF